MLGTITSVIFSSGKLYVSESCSSGKPLRCPSTCSLHSWRNSVRQTLSITDDFSLQYLDQDFEDFFTLHSTAEIQQSSICNQDHSMKMSPQNTPLIQPLQLPLHWSPPDSCSSCASTIIFSSNSSLQKRLWPSEFIIPQFFVETEIILERANEIYKKRWDTADLSKNQT